LLLATQHTFHTKIYVEVASHIKVTSTLRGSRFRNRDVNWWPNVSRARLKRDGTRADTKFGLSAKRTSPFKLAGVSVQSTTGSRGVRISGSNGSNAGYTMF